MTGATLENVLAEERRIMDLWAPHYDVATQTNAYVYRLERSQFVAWVLQTLREAGRDPRTLSVLDSGCGTGDVVERLSEEGVVNVTGLDLAPGMLTEARKRDVDACWVEGSIENPPFTCEAFDAILACFTLHHLHDPSAFFRLVESTLRPDGWFFILDFDARSGAWGSSRAGKARQGVGDVVRAAFARKNRHTLAAQPTVPRIFNPAHRNHDLNGIIRAIEHPERYELHRMQRGVLRPALIPVLVEESALDRTLARWMGAVDRHLAPRTGGVFQWVAGRRRP